MLRQDGVKIRNQSTKAQLVSTVKLTSHVQNQGPKNKLKKAGATWLVVDKDLQYKKGGKLKKTSNHDRSPCTPRTNLS